MALTQLNPEPSYTGEKGQAGTLPENQRPENPPADEFVPDEE